MPTARTVKAEVSRRLTQTGGGPPIVESFREALQRRGRHFLSHPILWSRYLWRHEVLHREDKFGDNPRHRDWTTVYRVSRGALARLLGVSLGELDGFANELEALHQEWFPEVAELPTAGALTQAPLLYLAVRARKPDRLVETGVSSGLSSRLLLEALDRNRLGHLYSVGEDRLALGSSSGSGGSALDARSAGWLVPDRLRSRWTLTLGKTEEVFPSLWSKIPGSLGLFLHDSRHDYATMSFEYGEGWTHLASGGILFSHDIHSTRAWPDFLREHQLTHDEELDHDLGGVMRPAG